MFHFPFNTVHAWFIHVHNYVASDLLNFEQLVHVSVTAELRWFVEVSRCRDVSVGKGAVSTSGHPYISFLFRMNFFISCFPTFFNYCEVVVCHVLF